MTTEGRGEVQHLHKWYRVRRRRLRPRNGDRYRFGRTGPPIPRLKWTFYSVMQERLYKNNKYKE